MSHIIFANLSKLYSAKTACNESLVDSRDYKSGDSDDELANSFIEHGYKSDGHRISILIKMFEDSEDNSITLDVADYILVDSYIK